MWQRNKMNTYQWQGVDANGLCAEGEIRASKKETASAQLKQQGIITLNLTRAGKQTTKSKVKPKQIHALTHELATLLNAHVTLSQAINILIKNSQHSLNPLLIQLQHALQSGQSFADALSYHPKLFDPTYISLIQAGEQSGMLAKIMQQLAYYQDRKFCIKQKIKKALYYPAIVFCVAFFITIGLLLFVVPQFQNVFASFDAKLPALTQAVIVAANLITHHGLLLFCSSLITILISHQAYRHPRSKKWFDTLLTHTPGLKNFIQQTILARWAGLLTTTLEAGLPLINALQLAQNSVHHYHYHQKLAAIAQQVQAGNSLANSCHHQRLFTPHTHELISVGENTATLTTMLAKIAELAEDRIEQHVQLLSKLLEPTIMLILSLIIGTLIIAMYLPVFNMGTVI